jgi:hypothetical protein
MDSNGREGKGRGGGDLPQPLEALLGVVLAGGGELDALPQQPRAVVPLHHLQRPRRPERAAEQSPARHYCWIRSPGLFSSSSARWWRRQRRSEGSDYGLGLGLGGPGVTSAINFIISLYESRHIMLVPASAGRASARPDDVAARLGVTSNDGLGRVLLFTWVSDQVEPSALSFAIGTGGR